MSLRSNVWVPYPACWNVDPALSRVGPIYQIEQRVLPFISGKPIKIFAAYDWRVDAERPLGKLVIALGEKDAEDGVVLSYHRQNPDAESKIEYAQLVHKYGNGISILDVLHASPRYIQSGQRNGFHNELFMNALTFFPYSQVSGLYVSEDFVREEYKQAFREIKGKPLESRVDLPIAGPKEARNLPLIDETAPRVA